MVNIPDNEYQESQARLKELEAERIDFKKAVRTAEDARAYAENIVATVREPLVVLDAELRIVSANRSFHRTFQVTPEESLGQSLYELGNRQWDIPSLRELLEKILPHNTAFNDFTVKHDFKTLGPRTMLLNARRVYRDETKTQLILLAIEDITEHKKAEETLEKYRKHLEELLHDLHETQERLVRQEKLAILGQMAGSVGHELRNPLGVISNAVYLLESILAGADDRTKSYLALIARYVRQSDKIISDLLDISRTKPSEPAAIAAADLVAAALDNAPPPDNITVTTAIAPDLPPARVDGRQIQLVLCNIITNACQAMPGGGALTVAAGAAEGAISISIADTGSGIRREDVPRIFEPLFTAKAHGIGLGLTVAKNLAEINGGRIKVDSEPGKGTTFTITLPAEKGTQ